MNTIRSTLKRKVRLATILGTLQSTLGRWCLRKVWKINTEEERLLGVSLLSWIIRFYQRPSIPSLARRDEASRRRYELKYANAIGIPQSTAITCVKPSGTVSQLVDAASCIHPAQRQYIVPSGTTKTP